MISIKTSAEVKIMREGGRILARVLRELEKKISPGIVTKDLNRLAEGLILNFGAKCSFKGYRGYPSCLCVSINEQIVHALPSERMLKEGDIVSLDLGVFWQGFHTDMAITAPVGKINKETKKLIEVTKKALKIGIKQVKPGNHIGDIGQVIQEVAESNGFNVVRELCGHGIGKEVHEEPEILDYGKKGAGPELKEGMVICIEPMITAGDWHLKIGSDKFAYETRDGSLSCHFEHTIAVTKNGAKILTMI